MWFKLLLLVNLCAAFPLKCPEPAQWALRANGHCTDPSKYFCLQNDLINGYSENCTRSDFQQPGRKAVLRGGVDADICSVERFQPFPLKFYTNVSTHCIFLKSLCNEEGQVVYENGDRNTDTTCRCDYRRGYDFLVKPNNPCFCKPSHEDCSCYLKTCSNSSYILSTDYDCIHKTDLSLVTQCRTITDENVISGRRLGITKSVPLEDNISFLEPWKKHSVKVVAVFIFGSIMVFCVSFKSFLKNCCRALVIRDPQPEIRLIEGAPLNLQYNIPTKRLRLRFFKDKKYIGESLNARQNVFRKQKVTLEDQGVYYAKLYFIKSSITKVNVDPMFTSEFNHQYCIEGETLHLKCSVYSEDIDVEWFKNNSIMFKKEKINENENISIDTAGKDHVMIIKNARLTDSGLYIIIAGNVQKQLTVTVKAFFKRPLEDTKIMEGIDVSFECEAEKPYPVAWFKDNNMISPSSKFKIRKLDNNVHKLTILKTDLEDKGKYRIQIKDKSTVSTAADLDVKEMPNVVKEMSVHDRDMFLKAASTGTAVRYYIRIMIVGESGVGKTCLLRRLMNESINGVNSTDGINIEVRKCKIDLQKKEWIFVSGDEFSSISPYETQQYADCGFWDFAGQKDFYATHQTFLSTNAIYLLVVDMSKDFPNKTFKHMVENKFDRSGEYIDFWLDNIHCYGINDENQASVQQTDMWNPPVIIVGTKVDRIQNEEQKSEKMKSIIKLFNQHTNFNHLRGSPYFLSNTEAWNHELEFKKLREHILEVAKDIPYWGDNLPTRWIVLEREIESKIAKNKYIISYEEAQQMAEICSFPISETNAELDSFLKYEHEIGNLIFFDSIKRYIILEPKWLVNVFKCFVSVPEFQFKFFDMNMMKEWFQLKSTGILSDSLITKLLEKEELNSAEQRNFALQIMETFDIIVKHTNKEGKENYYMPCMIKASSYDDIIDKFNLNSSTCTRTPWFCLVFKFLPPAFLNHILVTFIKEYVVCSTKDDTPSIYRGIGIFNLDKYECQKLIVCLSKNYVAMQVWEFHHEEQQICHGNYSNIREYLIDNVDLIQKKYKMNIHYTSHLKCSKGMYDEETEQIACDDVKMKIICSEHGVSHTLVDLRRTWFEEEKKVNTSQKDDIPVKCHYCEKMPVYRCYECSNVLCDDCYQEHDKLYNRRDHTFQSTNDKLLLNHIFKVSHSILDMKALSGGLLVFASHHSDMLLTYSVSDKQQHEISIDGKPCSVAILDKNNVVVLLTRTFKKIESLAKVNIRKRQVIQKVDLTLSSPDIFCPMLYIDGQLYITSRGGITVTDMSGILDTNVDFLKFVPRHMCYNAKVARIYRIDESGKKLICFDKDGNIIFTYPYLTKAKRLTIDNEGCVLILCNEDNGLKFKVYRISCDGKSSDVILTGETKEAGVNKFSSICFQEESDEVVIGYRDTVYCYKKK